jgi:Na+-translocating ferredoxin:NAD+ oxidoreductase RnfC subunit
MAKSYIDRIRDAGVVGAGGAGFPTHIKINNNAEVIIANGAECEPLLRIDRQMMETFPEKLIEGMQVVMKISKADKGVICLKGKYHLAIEKLTKAIGNKKKIELYLLDNYYPAGDEQQMVYEVTGKVVPTGGLPIDVGVIVNNVSTLINVADSIEEIPVTNKFVTVTGEVKNPVTLNVPIGTPIIRLIELAGGVVDKARDYSLIEGGPAMGKIQDDWEAPVTKTLGGVIVLPSEHKVIRKKRSSLGIEYKLAKSVCCQCNYCTQLCPRNALGLRVEPHKVMRAVGYGDMFTIGDINTIFSCCDCGLCTYYACNMELSPSRMMTTIKDSLLKKGMKPKKAVPARVNPLREYLKVPAGRFVERLGLSRYDVEAPLLIDEIKVKAVKIPLKQHIGVPAKPVVAKGDPVEKGDLIGSVEGDKVGANIHASITGIVVGVTDQYVEIDSTEQEE